VIVVIKALTQWKNMNLYAPCHQGSWSASQVELDIIRLYLGEAWIGANAG
jgi:hypothetical protein